MPKPELTLLFDGNCPICTWEIRNLTRRDKQNRLAFVSIHDPEFDPARYGANMQDLMASLHGITADGRVIKGMDTLLASYRAVGWWWAYLPLSALPRTVADKGYAWFARHRHTISRRLGPIFGPACDGEACRRK